VLAATVLVGVVALLGGAATSAAVVTADTTAAAAEAPAATAVPAEEAAPAASSVRKPKRGGSVGNSYASQLNVINDMALRITTRKRVSGSMDEVTRPGSSTYRALQAVADAASLRAAIETKYLGYGAFRVRGFRNLTTSQQPRANSLNATGEAGYTFGPGNYNDSIELAIELTIELLPAMPAEPEGKDVYDVEPILQAAGISG
jgi:hypothetical protein